MAEAAEQTESVRCSRVSAAIAEPLGGSAPTASFVLALEQPGPWGVDPVLDSDLDHDLGSTLGALVSAAGGRLLLIRHPLHHRRNPDADITRNVVVSFANDMTCWAVTLRLAAHDFDVLTHLDWESVAAGSLTPLQPFAPEPSPPLVLVCTNGRRDACCALWGRPIALEVAQQRPEQVWEATHLGGHRYAPTVLVLPTMAVYGRTDTALCMRALEWADRGDVWSAGLRGRMHLAPPLQAADAYLRERFEIAGHGDLRLSAAEFGATATCVDGRQWSLHLREVTGEILAASSCGKQPKPVSSWQVWIGSPDD